MNETVLFENKWIQVVDRDGYTMYRLPWCKNGLGVAILPFKKFKTMGPYGEIVQETLYLGRFEVCPAHSPHIKLTAITGGMDKEGESPLMCAVRELEEEAGVRLKDTNAVINLGYSFDSKMSDHETVLYAVDMDKANYELVHATGDGSKWEENAYARWVTEEQCILASELRLAGMIARLKMIYEIQ
jgi:8-oxo-dGTP pyrophosphatase MutT (NUDIX family)